MLRAYYEVLRQAKGFEQCRLLQAAPVFGVRESRHIDGNFKIEVAEAYYIPYRSMQPNGCGNLIVAGKCAVGDVDVKNLQATLLEHGAILD